jgi:hypothetical protein
VPRDDDHGGGTNEGSAGNREFRRITGVYSASPTTNGWFFYRVGRLVARRHRFRSVLARAAPGIDRAVGRTAEHCRHRPRRRDPQHYGFFVLGVFSGHAVYFPELVSTHVRATAALFCNGAARVITSFGPLVAGLLAAPFGGNFNKPAAIMPCFARLNIYGMYLGRENQGAILASLVVRRIQIVHRKHGRSSVYICRSPAAAFHSCLPGEGRDLCSAWAPAFAGVTRFL